MDKNDLERIASQLIANEPQQSQRKSCETESPIMLRFWLRMNEMYGSLWESSQGLEPNETWAIGLGGLTPDQIGHGLIALRDSAKPFPPTLPEFIGLAKGPQNAPFQHLQSRPCHEALSAPIIDRSESAEIARLNQTDKLFDSMPSTIGMDSEQAERVRSEFRKSIPEFGNFKELMA